MEKYSQQITVQSYHTDQHGKSSICSLFNFMDTFPRYQGTSACRAPEKIRPPKMAEDLRLTPVLFSELDINRHFNSVKALERVLDHFGIDFLNSYEPESIEVNYLKEGLAGDRLAVSTVRGSELEYLSSIVREQDRVSLSNMRITWRPRQD